MEIAIDTLLRTARLRRELGEKLFTALVSPDNTAAVREFAEKLVEAVLPTEMTIGGVTYNILGFHLGKEKSILGDTMVKRAKEMSAHNGKDERNHILAHQDEIPSALRDKVAFVFTDDRYPDRPAIVRCAGYDGVRWVLVLGMAR